MSWATPFLPGIAVRWIAREYLRAILITMFGLLIVALSIDLVSARDALAQLAAKTNQNLLGLYAYYLSLRGVDIVTRLLPLACYAGVFIAENMRRRRLETVILEASTAGPLMALKSALMLGLVLGVFQMGLESWLRPEAVAQQIRLGVGNYADRFSQDGFGRTWLLSDDTAALTHIVRSDPPILRDVVVFDGVRSAALKQVIFANEASPLSRPGQWHLTDVQIWTATADGLARTASLPGLDFSLPILERNARYIGIEGYYLHTKDLLELAGNSDMPGYQQARTGIARRVSAAALPVVALVLGISLAQLVGLSNQLRTLRVAAISIFGYLIIVSIKIFWALGEFGSLSPFWAVSGSISLALGVSFAAQIRLATGPWRTSTKKIAPDTS